MNEDRETLRRRRHAFLRRVARTIPTLFAAIERGNVKAEMRLGERRVGARRVALRLVAEVIDPGANPLATHGAAAPREER